MGSWRAQLILRAGLIAGCLLPPHAVLYAVSCCAELMKSGRLGKAADVFSFGVMSECVGWLVGWSCLCCKRSHASCKSSGWQPQVTKETKRHTPLEDVCPSANQTRGTTQPETASSLTLCIHACAVLYVCVPTSSSCAVWEVFMAAHPWKGLTMGEVMHRVMMENSRLIWGTGVPKVCACTCVGGVCVVVLFSVAHQPALLQPRHLQQTVLGLASGCTFRCVAHKSPLPHMLRCCCLLSSPPLLPHYRTTNRVTPRWLSSAGRLTTRPGPPLCRLLLHCRPCWTNTRRCRQGWTRHTGASAHLTSFGVCQGCVVCVSCVGMCVMCARCVWHASMQCYGCLTGRVRAQLRGGDDRRSAGGMHLCCMRVWC